MKTIEKIITIVFGIICLILLFSLFIGPDRTLELIKTVINGFKIGLGL